MRWESDKESWDDTELVQKSITIFSCACIFEIINGVKSHVVESAFVWKVYARVDQDDTSDEQRSAILIRYSN